MNLSYNEISHIIDNYEIPMELLSKNWVIVANGGLFIAQRLAYLYGKRLGFFDSNTLVKTNETENVLLIEDVVGTGNTLKKCKKEFPDSQMLAFVYDPNNVSQPDYYIYESSEWVIFPWEDNTEGYKRKVEYVNHVE